MKLETMAKDTLPVAREALKLWPVQAGEVVFFRASANFVWGFQAGDGHIILRLSSREERSEPQVHAELEYVTWLASQGFSVAMPIPH
jgi:Ser/Thr protein kinase RdoA (MazF antagonist)